MKNIHLIPTDKPSRLVKAILSDNLLLADVPNTNKHYTKYNIYITSDEVIKEGDWVLKFPFNELVFKALEVKKDEFVQEKRLCKYPYNWCKKIILTTDQDLIAEGIQQIDDEFLEWFVKNPSCESVEVEYGDDGNGYQIIIPKEEPKQETLVNDFMVWDELFGILAWKFKPTKSGDMFLDAEKVFEELKDKFELKKK